jgi:hypothetical protein
LAGFSQFFTHSFPYTFGIQASKQPINSDSLPTVNFPSTFCVGNFLLIDSFTRLLRLILGLSFHHFGPPAFCGAFNPSLIVPPPFLPSPHFGVGVNTWIGLVEGI